MLRTHSRKFWRLAPSWNTGAAAFAVLLLAFVGGQASSISTAIPAAFTTPIIGAIGDSITFGFGLSSPSTQNYAFVATNPLVNPHSYSNFAVSGKTCAQITTIAQSTSNLVSFLSTPHYNSIAVVLCGTNDMTPSVGNMTPAQAFTNLTGLLTAINAASPPAPNLLVGTLIDSTSTEVSEANRATFNALVIAGASSQHYTVLPFGADPVMGCVGCFSNSTYFQGDGIHPTATGQAVMATYLRNAVNGLGVQ